MLYQTMGEFATRNINLLKIESRPTKQSLGDYIFLIDCAGHRQDDQVKEAIDAMRESVSMIKVLGSYPRWGESRGK